MLRHQPEAIGIKLDEQGWVGVAELIKQVNAHGKSLTTGILNHVVATNAKKRFAFNDAGDKIRASQGHSLHVELGLQPQTPPALLYHGTGVQSAKSILQTGIEKRSRQHVHLSADTETAIKVGQRHGKPAIFEVNALTMHNNGQLFYISENGVWLTDTVPAAYIKLK